MQRRLFALSLLAGGSILATACGGGGGGSGATPLDPEPGPSPAPTGPGPTTIAYAYIAKPERGEVSTYWVQDDGTFEAVGTAPAEAGASSVAIHPSGRFAYVVNTDAGSVSIYDRDLTDGLLYLKHSLTVETSNPTHFRFHPSGEIAYVAGSSGVGIYAVDIDTGALEFLRLEEVTAATGLDVHPSGAYVFVARDIGFVRSFNTDGATLGEVDSDITTPLTAELVVSPSGTCLYVSGRDARIATHRVYPDSDANLVGDAALIGLGDAGGPFTIHPSGLFAYAAADFEGQFGVHVLEIDGETGALTQRGFHVMGVEVLAMTISPSGRFIYTANRDSNAVSVLSIHETTGELASGGEPISIVGGNPASICIVERVL